MATGLPACPGVVLGRAYADVDDALDAADTGEDVILVRTTTSPDDVQGMLAARGIVTEIGGATSHAGSGQPGYRTACGGGLWRRRRRCHRRQADHRRRFRGRSPPKEFWRLRPGRRTTHPTCTSWPSWRVGQQPAPGAHAAGDHPALEDTSPDGVRAALAAGYSDVISPTPLITMLIALRLQTASDRGELSSKRL